MRPIFRTRQKLLAITLPLVLFPLILILILNSLITGSLIKSFILERLDNSNRQINDNFDLLTDQMEEIMRGIIINNDVQRFLIQRDISHGTINEINSFLKLYNFGHIREIVLGDNQGNIVQTNEQSAVTYRAILTSHIQSEITDTYAKQVWTFHDDDISGNAGRFLFISRYLRHLDLNVDPGILIFKISPAVLDEVFDRRLMVEGADYLLFDQHDQLVFHSTRPELVGAPIDRVLADYDALRDLLRLQNAGAKLGRNIISFHLNRRTGWKIFGIIPYRIAMKQLRRMQSIIYLIMLFAAAVTMAVEYATTSMFTKPIQELERAMHSFRDGGFDTRVSVRSEDEIGEMGKSFNLMADEISALLKTIQQDQEALTAAELESLAYQINPHFIYNTLDNVHMLSRSTGDERIGRLIISLTKFLRISLSKGHNTISISEEFEHVTNYLNIQRIRFGETFDFTVALEPAIAELQIVKFILQPLTENCINHGFRDIESGGRIAVTGAGSRKEVVIAVEDNGAGMDPKTCRRLNSLPSLSTEEMRQAFPESRGGYGIGNVIARLNICYGKDYRIEFFSDDSTGTRCVLRFWNLPASASK